MDFLFTRNMLQDFDVGNFNVCKAIVIKEM
jgi:hypothetical protein